MILPYGYKVDGLLDPTSEGPMDKPEELDCRGLCPLRVLKTKKEV